MNTMLIVFFKEVKENLRDKRTMMSALLFSPLIGPLFLVMIMNVVITRELNKADQPLKVPVIGAEYAPNLISALKQQGFVPQPGIANPEKAVRDMDADVVLRIPKDFGDSWRKGQASQVEMIYDSSQRDTGLAKSGSSDCRSRSPAVRSMDRYMPPTKMASTMKYGRMANNCPARDCGVD